MAGQEKGRRYRAFITYSHRDARWAAWLHRRLEGYRVPRRLVGREIPGGRIPRRLTPIFRDREELATADDLSERISNALADSGALIVVCSPAAAQSRWVNEEILRFKRSGRGNRIFCLIVAGTPFASESADDESECLPPALRYRLGADGNPTRERAEPLAADVRPGGDGRALAKLKLVAGLLGLDLDELRRREQQRRNLRWAGVTTLALLVTAATSLLAVEATVQRHAAERRQKQAEDLVAFMLGNFTQKLSKLGRLDILSSLDKQAMRYFESLPPSDVSENTLIQRAKALEQIGATRSDQGDYAGAMEAFQTEFAITSALAKKHSDDAQRQRALSDNLQWIFFMDYSQGNMVKAERAMRQAIAALEDAATLAPSDSTVQASLAAAHNNFGHLAEQLGKREEAQAQYAQYLKISLHGVASHPGDVDWLNKLGDAYNDLGKLAIAKGDFLEAVRDYVEDQRIVAMFVHKNPSDQTARASLMFSDGILGRTLFLCGQWRAGMRYVREAVSLGDQLVAYEPTQTDWRDGRALYSSLLADFLLQQGTPGDAEPLAETSVTDLQKLAEKDSRNPKWRSNLAAAKLTAARVAHALHKDDAARALATAAASSLEKVLKNSTATPDDPSTAVGALLLLAGLAEAGGDGASAGEFRDQALKTIMPAARASGNPLDLAAEVSALLAAGNVSEAQTVIDRLQSMGYRTPGFVALLEAHGIDYPVNTTVSAKIARLVDSDGAADMGVEHTASSRSPSNLSSRQGEMP